MRARTCCFLPIVSALLLLSSPASAQQLSLLTASRTVPAGSAHLGPATALPIRCTRDGRVYYRDYDATPRNSVVIGISADGSASVRYQFPDDDSFEDGFLNDFAVKDDGGVILMAQKGAEAEAVEFDPQGRLLRRVFFPGMGGVLSYAMNGADEIIALGIDPKLRTAMPILLAMDLRSAKVIADSMPGSAFQLATFINLEMSERIRTLSRRNEIAVGSRGETYILTTDRGTRLTKLVSGQAAITAEVQAPADNAIPIQLMVAKDRVAVLFNQYTQPLNTTYIQMLDPGSLRPRLLYKVDPQSAGSAACMTDSAVVFLSRSQDGHAVLREAALP